MLVQKTLDAYDKHGTIIIGVDFDDTIFPLNTELEERCEKVRGLLTGLMVKYNAKLCLFSVADSQSLKYKSYIMDQWGIKPTWINEPTLVNWGKCSKPYFNLYIDDKSGINEMIEVMEELIKL